MLTHYIKEGPDGEYYVTVQLEEMPETLCGDGYETLREAMNAFSSVTWSHPDDDADRDVIRVGVF